VGSRQVQRCQSAWVSLRMLSVSMSQKPSLFLNKVRVCCVVGVVGVCVVGVGCMRGCACVHVCALFACWVLCLWVVFLSLFLIILLYLSLLVSPSLINSISTSSSNVSTSTLPLNQACTGMRTTTMSWHGTSRTGMVKSLLNNRRRMLEDITRITTPSL
jgi:hypothetical protein